MRKLVLSLGLVMCLAASASAQNEEVRAVGTTTQSGQQILPQAGDFAIGIDATPILKYAGNMFNNSTENNANGLFNGETQTIYGKYFLKDNAAIRAKLGINMFSLTNKADIRSSADADVILEDAQKISRSNFRLDLGYELRRGYGRLQGFYGAGLGFGFGSAGSIDDNDFNYKYDYANAMTSTYPTPPTTDFGNNNVLGNARVTKTSLGNGFDFNVNAFVGVEYFFAPKMSIGGELGLAYVYENNSKGEVTTEAWENNAVKTTTTKYHPDYSNAYAFATKFSGNLFVMFYF